MTDVTTNPTAHLSDVDIDALGHELDAIRNAVLDDLGEDDARYIRRVIAAQRRLEAGGRGALLVSLFPPAWLAGTAMLSVAKILENMEIGHNVLHGQWDWMRDPEIHSANWEWDSASTADGWKHAHNYVHHTYTNVLGKDRDLGYSILRIEPDQPWHPVYLAQPIYIVPMALLFEWAIAIYDIELENVRAGKKPWPQAKAELGGLLRKARRQLVKDYIAFPALSGPSAIPAFLGNLTANAVRNVWAHTIIVCGHFPDGAHTFTEEQLEAETRGGWYIRQLLGSCNLDGPPLLHLLSGNLSYQIEHHLFPDVPSNRYAELAPKVRELCGRYGLPYTSGPLHRQYAQVVKRVLRLALPGPRREPHEHVDAGRQVPAPAPPRLNARPAPAAATARVTRVHAGPA
jgi:NADPH-dependent stearoyl-CoA 9-desaturase